MLDNGDMTKSHTQIGDKNMTVSVCLGVQSTFNNDVIKVSSVLCIV